MYRSSKRRFEDSEEEYNLINMVSDAVALRIFASTIHRPCVVSDSGLMF